jgi:hypothetical protein
MCKGWAIKSGPCTVTFSDLLCYPYSLTLYKSYTLNEMWNFNYGGVIKVTWLQMPLRGECGAEVIKPGLWSNGRRSFGRMSPPSHCFQLLAEFTSGERHPKLTIQIVCCQEWNMTGVRSWYGQPYRGILSDPSLPCKVTSLPNHKGRNM